jgi:hypothetical protein
MMGRHRGQRTFNPHTKKDIGQHVLDEFNGLWEKVADITRRGALAELIELLDADHSTRVGDAIMTAISTSMLKTSMQIEKVLMRHRTEQEEIQKMVDEEEKKLLEAMSFAKEAADAAFPGVEDE